MKLLEEWFRVSQAIRLKNNCDKIRYLVVFDIKGCIAEYKVCVVKAGAILKVVYKGCSIKAVPDLLEGFM